MAVGPRAGATWRCGCGRVDALLPGGQGHGDRSRRAGAWGEMRFAGGRRSARPLPGLPGPARRSDRGGGGAARGVPPGDDVQPAGPGAATRAHGADPGRPVLRHGRAGRHAGPGGEPRGAAGDGGPRERVGTGGREARGARGPHVRDEGHRLREGARAAEVRVQAMDPGPQAADRDPVAVTGAGHVLGTPCDPAPYLRVPKNRKFMGAQTHLAAGAAGRAVEAAGRGGQALGERAGLYMAVGSIPFEREHTDLLLRRSIDADGRVSMARFSTDAFGALNPLLTF